MHIFIKNQKILRNCGVDNLNFLNISYIFHPSFMKKLLLYITPQELLRECIS